MNHRFSVQLLDNTDAGLASDILVSDSQFPIPSVDDLVNTDRGIYVVYSRLFRYDGIEDPEIEVIIRCRPASQE
jgi:hypothetical protein